MDPSGPGLDVLSLAVEAGGSIIICLLTLPSFFRLVQRIVVSRKGALYPSSALYKDEDGAATEESQARFKVLVPTILILTASGLGFLLSISLGVLSTVRRPGLVPSQVVFHSIVWLDVAIWILLFLQSLNVALERDPVKRFHFGLCASPSSLLQAAIIAINNWAPSATVRVDAPYTKAHNGITIAEFLIAILLSILCLCIPRRPSVYLPAGKVVDAQFTGSALSRYSFAWAAPILTLAGARPLSLDDLPAIDSRTRSQRLLAAFSVTESIGRLWKRLFWAHLGVFVMQWVLSAMQTATSFGPQVALLKLLSSLEKHAGTSSPEAWIWVFGLGFFMILTVLIDARLLWSMIATLGIPIRVELEAAIYQKAMRRRNTQDAQNLEEKESDGDTSSGSSTPDPKKAKQDSGSEKETMKASHQGMINLMAVDSQRISSFAGFNFWILQSFLKLIVSIGFLWGLIGWQSLSVGLATNILSLPLNIYFTKTYARAQDKLMKARDEKLAVVTEALQGIRQIKFSALEPQWQNKIQTVREREMKQLWHVFVCDTMLKFCWVAGPVFLSAAALSTYALIHGELQPSVAFTALSLFNTLERNLNIIPDLLTDLMSAKVSADRIEAFFKTLEKTENTTEANSISFEDASIAWPSDKTPDELLSRFVLRNVTASFPPGELSVISGKTGSGKSLLLSAILGESDLLGGKIHRPRCPSVEERMDHLATPDDWIIPSSIAFVSQIPWIENATIKDNILFGLPFIPDRYEKVIRLSALTRDLEMFTDGDATEVGAQGISLSGGQRWRLTFARALYSRAGILVLDDLFSALDAHVGKEIFENGLTGDLATGRTRILVTHHVGLCLSRTKYTLSLKDGVVEHAGLVEDLRRSGILSDILSHEHDLVDDKEIIGGDAPDGSPTNSQANVVKKGENGALSGSPSDSEGRKPKKLIEEETKERGHIKWDIYLRYYKASGGAIFWTTVIFAFVIQQILFIGRSWWVKTWTGSYKESSYASLHHKALDQTQPLLLSVPAPVTKWTVEHSLGYYLGIYIAICFTSAMIGTLRYFYIYTGSLRASRRIFMDMTARILRTPLRWLDTTPMGRILNRFTADFNIVDLKLAHDLGVMTESFMTLMGVFVAGLIVSPYIILLCLIVVFGCVYIARQYLAGAREAKRLESISKSPMFELFGSSLHGLSTIRAADKVDMFMARMYRRIDNHATAYWHMWLFSRWLGFRMSMIGAVFATCVAAVAVSTSSIGASLAGFALALCLEFPQSVVTTIRMYSNTELDMNSAERVIEYSNVKTEDVDGADPPAGWPSEGRLRVNNLVVGYADDLPAVLKGLSFRIERNERVGVVGRTGAGKSSLTLALFRFLEAREGQILIDGLDISKIKLHHLRSRLAIIPQDPTLFSGTVRSNLDPFDQCEEVELNEALRRVHLVDPEEANVDGVRTPGGENVNIFESLNSPISDSGMNLSQGQRQLLCLARAILSRPKIMILDEATSAVDMATDRLIQRSIREEFTDSTLVVIAHRLSTIADFDKILVMSDGKGVEFGTPKELMEIKGVFYGMVKDSGEKEKLEEMILGEGAAQNGHA